MTTTARLTAALALALGMTVGIAIGQAERATAADGSSSSVLPAPVDGKMRHVCASVTAPGKFCRQRGWVMQPLVHIGPSGYVRWLSADVPACPEYDGTNNEPGVRCWWDHPLLGEPGQLGESYVWVGDFFLIVPGYRCDATTCPTHAAAVEAATP